MNTSDFVRDIIGVRRLPPGFRFEPTDEELVFHYLKSKVFSCPLPASIIPDLFNFFSYDPWDLPVISDSEKERYFFSKKEVKHQNRGKRSNLIRTSSGYWKAIHGSEEKIVSSSTRNLITSTTTTTTCSSSLMGMKKSLVFYRGKPALSHVSRTDWVMHEYRLYVINNAEASRTNTMENWVLCRVFLKKRSNCDYDYINGAAPPDSSTSTTSSASSSSNSNSFTDITAEISSCSSTGSDHDHEKTHCYQV